MSIWNIQTSHGHPPRARAPMPTLWRGSSDVESHRVRVRAFARQGCVYSLGLDHPPQEALGP
eukprot:scaffold1578_cov340-Prasinococcus_capsulatus_cf.AAC.2